MSYAELLNRVQSAQKRKTHITYPTAECELITYLLSKLKEGIQKDQFPKSRRTGMINLIEIQFKYNQLCVFVKHRNSSLVKVIKCESCAHINTRIILDLLKELGLICEVVSERKHVNKIFVRIELKPEKETL